MIKADENMTVAVIILTMNQRDKTLCCLSSLFKSNHLQFQVVLWDNGSEDGTPEAVQEKFPEVHTHHHHTNLGVASGRNNAAELAIELFQPQYLLFLDNDMEVEQQFINALMQPLIENKQVGQTQAKLRFMNDRARLNDGGGCRINFMLGLTQATGFNEIDEGQYDTAKKCVACGGAMMVRTDVFQMLNGFDTFFDPFGPEDLDFSLRLQKAGYIALYVPKAVAYHELSHSFGANYDENYARYRSRHWLLFMRRHAPLWQKVIFLAITAPLLFFKIMIREVRNGNLHALRGLIKGVVGTGKTQIENKGAT